MNGYMVVDAKTDEIGYVEMSYKSFRVLSSRTARVVWPSPPSPRD